MAIELAKRGAGLVLLDIDEEENKKTSDAIKSFGFTRVSTFTTDLSNEEKLKATLRRVKETVGDVTMVILAAGPKFQPKSIMDLSYADIEKAFMVSYMSQLWLIQEYLREMIKKKHGHIVCVSSVSAFVDIPLVSTYSAFKY